MDKAGYDYRKGALPFLFAAAAAGTGASVLLVPRAGKAVAEEAAAVAAAAGSGRGGGRDVRDGWGEMKFTRDMNMFYLCLCFKNVDAASKSTKAKAMQIN